MKESNVLDGIRVLDFGIFIAGPFCAALLADYGADVIRVDRVGGGDDRFLTPVTEQGDGAFFLQVNRNKRSLSLDITSPEGKEVVRQLVLESDVVIANMPPRTLKTLGLDYESLKAIKPNIILTASSAFGSHPSLQGKVGFDGSGQAMSGAVYMSGYPDQPVKFMVPVVDFGTAMACAFGTMMALYERQLSGEGQEVSACLLHTALNYSSGTLIEEAVLELGRKATLNRAPTFAPSDIFRTRDGWIITQVIGNGMFKRWANLIGRPEVVDDPHFANDRLRGENGEEISKMMTEWTEQHTVKQALDKLEQAGIPASNVNSPRQALEDEAAVNSGAFHWFEYPGTKKPVPGVVPPASLSRTSPEFRRRPPTAGEHTDEILTELGYARSSIEDMRKRGII